jgi:tetratricopeptide (TPR) repeat protein
MYTDSYKLFQELMRQRKYIDAAEHAERESLEDNGAFWLTQQARALNAARRFPEALDCARRALHRNPSNSYALCARAESCFFSGDIDTALSDYGELTGEPKVGARAREGVLKCLYKLGKGATILERIEEWSFHEPELSAWRARGWYLEREYGKALDACRKWVDSQPENRNALWLLTNIEIECEGLEPVMARLKRIAKIPSRSRVYGEIYASLCRRAGKIDSAVGQYDKLTQSKPDPALERKKAFAYAKSGREMEAIPVFEEILKSKPSDYYVHKSYLSACRRAGLLQRAETFLEQLLERWPAEKGLYGRIKAVRKERIAHPQ